MSRKAAHNRQDRFAGAYALGDERPSPGTRLLARLLDERLAWRFVLAEAIGSSPLVPPSSGFLAVRRPRPRKPGPDFSPNRLPGDAEARSTEPEKSGKS